MTDLFEYTNFFPRNTGLPVTIWVSVNGVVATNPHDRSMSEDSASEIDAWIRLNREALLAHWNGEIDGAEMAARTRKL